MGKWKCKFIISVFKFQMFCFICFYLFVLLGWQIGQCHLGGVISYFLFIHLFGFLSFFIYNILNYRLLSHSIIAPLSVFSSSPHCCFIINSSVCLQKKKKRQTNETNETNKWINDFCYSRSIKKQWLTLSQNISKTKIASLDLAYFDFQKVQKELFRILLHTVMRFETTILHFLQQS
jgi:hypothetical protein